MKAALCLLLALTVACGDQTPPDPPRVRLRLTTGTPGGGFQPLGDALARAVREGLPYADVEVRQSAGSISNVEAIQSGQADAGFAFADVAYTAFAGGLSGRAERFDRLRGIAVLQLTPLHVVASGRSAIRSIGELRGRRVAVGLPGSGSALTADLVMKAFALGPADVALKSLAYNVAARQLAADLDAMFIVGSVPLESVSMAVRDGARLVPLEGDEIERLRHRHRFLKRAVIPGGAYSGHPTQVVTIGVDNILVCSSELDEAVVYALTRRLFDALPSLAAEHPSLRLVDLDQLPATPIPLHEGAARFYREREVAR